jgi:O-antigen/teichoic acid export membrane protein
MGQKDQPHFFSSFAQLLPSQIGRRVMVNAVALASSNLWRILTSFVLQLLIAHRLGLEALGIYTIVMAYLNVGQVASELGLPGLLVRDLAQHPEQRLGYFRIATTIQTAASLLTWVVLIVLAWVLPFPRTTQLALMVGGAFLPLAALTSVTQMLFQAGERMELVLGVEGLINTLILLLSIAVLWLGGGLVALVGLLVLTQAVSALLGLWLVRRSALTGGAQAAVAEAPAALLRRALPFYGLALADVLLQRIDILLLSIVAGEAVTAIYSAAYQFVRVLTKLIQSFWRALYPTLSRLRQQGHLAVVRLATNGWRAGVVTLFPVVTLAALLAQPLLLLLFGPTAVQAAPVLQVLIWSVPLFMTETYATTLLVVEQQPARSLWVSCLHVIIIVFLLPLLTSVGGATGAAWAMVLAGLVSGAVGWWLVRNGVGVARSVGRSL